MEPQAATLIGLIKGLLTLSGPLVGVSLTGFTFLVTRTVDKVDKANEPARSLRVLGPFCLLFSAALALYAFVVLTFMSRLNEAELRLKDGEFVSWLSPVHLLAMVLFLAVLFLGMGLYYVTRLWLSETGLSSHSSRRAHILHTMLLWIFVAPFLLFFYIAMVIYGLWSSKVGAGWCMPYWLSAMTMLLVGVPALGGTWWPDKPIWIMRLTLVAVLLFSVLQVAQNVAWANGWMSTAFDMMAVSARMVFVAVVSTFMLGALMIDFRRACDGDAAIKSADAKSHVPLVYDAGSDQGSPANKT